MSDIISGTVVTGMALAEPVITSLTVAAGMALGIERGLELLKHFMDSANGSLGAKERKNMLADVSSVVQEAEDAISHPLKATFTGIDVGFGYKLDEQGQVARIATDAEASEKYPPPAIPIIPQTPLSTIETANVLFFQMAAAGLGIILAWIFNVRLLNLLTAANNLVPEQSFGFILLDIVFSGLVIGGGSQPIHLLIRFLTERKVSGETEVVIKENEKVKALGKVVSTAALIEEQKEENPLQWKDIVYKGGINPESLEKTHLRPANPNLIVYHHTAMSSVLDFQTVVDEFLLKKKWLTGYHCVIMPNGDIKPFCRWDRYGNHAKGINARSLGISFHGNFHTDPGDKYSNADGRYGNQQPTEAQLHAGARVTALWVALYDDIELDFDKCILPHKEAMPNHTVCPGSNFKYEQFKQLVRQYHESWADSELAQGKIEEFKKLAYVYA